MTGRGYKTPDAEVRGRVACRGLFAGSKTPTPQSTLATARQPASDWMKAGLHARLGKSDRHRGTYRSCPRFSRWWLHAICPTATEDATV